MIGSERNGNRVGTPARTLASLLAGMLASCPASTAAARHVEERASPHASPEQPASPSAEVPPSSFETLRAEGRRLFDAGDHAAAARTWSAALDEAPSDITPAARAEMWFEIGLAERRAFDDDGDTAHLHAAKKAAEQCLATLPEGADPKLRSQAVGLKADVDRTLGWDEPATPAAQPAPAQPPAPVATPPPEPLTPDELDRQRRIKAAEGVAIGGYVFVGVGAVSVVLLALPALIAAEVARDRAEGDPLLVSKEELQRREKNRKQFALVAGIVGAGSLLVGGILIGAGLGRRAALRREARPKAQVRLLPAPTGGSLHVSF